MDLVNCTALLPDRLHLLVYVIPTHSHLASIFLSADVSVILRFSKPSTDANAIRLAHATENFNGNK